MSYGSLSRGILDLWCSIFHATLVIPFSKYHQDTGAELAFLDLSNLSPRLPSQRTRMWISRSSSGIASDSPCQMQREYWMHLHAASLATGIIAIQPVLANHYMKMFAILLMCSIMITQTIRRITFIALVELVVLVQREPQSPFSLLIVCHSHPALRVMFY